MWGIVPDLWAVNTCGKPWADCGRPCHLVSTRRADKRGALAELRGHSIAYRIACGPHRGRKAFMQVGMAGVELKIGSADRTTRAYQWRLRQVFVDITGSLCS